jgi:transcriptional regulator with XRE-family HTH domain
MRAEKRSIAKAIGENVRRERARRGLSQEKLAFAADLHPNYVGFVERGERSITVVNLVRIAKALKVPAFRLFRGVT